MAPHDDTYFEPAVTVDWIAVDSGWFERLARLETLSVADRIHLARVALQQQWICDVEDTEAKRAVIDSLGLPVATTNLGYLIVSGSPTMAEYFAFRGDGLSLVETGILYGYPPSAVIAYAGITASRPPHYSWMTPATYFLGGTTPPHKATVSARRLSCSGRNSPSARPSSAGKQSRNSSDG